jgi:membrane protease YdiL (CAAX protease family)
VPLWDVLVSGALAVVFALLGVGLWVRRSWPEVLERLGVADLEPGSVMAGISVAGALLGFITLAGGLWLRFSPQTFEELGSATEVLFGGFTSIPAALVVAASTALGEELLFRGALQPRLGLLPTTLLFALLHVQYTLSPASLIILGVGLGFGLLRRWRDTTASIVAHFVYNFALLALAMVVPQ